MTIKISLRALRTSLSRHAGPFGAAKDRHLTLAGYASPEDLLANLRATSPLSASARDAITVALVSEYQTGRHPLWTSLLLLAFEPMLRRLAGRVRAHGEDEVCQLAISAFLEVVDRLPVKNPPARVALHFRSAVAERVFAALGKTRRESPLPKVMETGPEAFELSEPANDTSERVEQLIEVGRVVNDWGQSPEVRAMLIATVVEGESLLGYVQRVLPAANSNEQGLAYSRLRTAQKKALAEIDSRLGDGAPRIYCPALLALQIRSGHTPFSPQQRAA